jgi:hypothetical protein
MEIAFAVTHYVQYAVGKEGVLGSKMCLSFRVMVTTVTSFKTLTLWCQILSIGKV